MYLDETYDNDLVKMIGALSRIKALAESGTNDSDSIDNILSTIIEECEYAITKPEDEIAEARRALTDEEDCCS